MEWVTMNKLARDEAAEKEFQSFLTAYHDNPDKWNKIYTFDTYNLDWYYLDGVKKIPFVKRDMTVSKLQYILLSNVI